MQRHLACLCALHFFITHKIKLDNRLRLILPLCALSTRTSSLPHFKFPHFWLKTLCRLQKNKALISNDPNKSSVFVPWQLDTEGPWATVISHTCTHVFFFLEMKWASAVQSGSRWKAFVSKIDCVTVAHMPNSPAENDSGERSDC